MPFLDKLTDKFGEMMKEKLSGGKFHQHIKLTYVTDQPRLGKEQESSEQYSHGEHQKENDHEAYGHGYAGPPPGPPGSNMMLPPGWIQQWDANSQRYYYVEQATGCTQWEPPTADYGLSSDIHHLGGSVPGQYYSHDERTMYAGSHEGQHYEGEHGEEKKKKDSHTGLTFAGGAALGALGGAWAAHEYSALAHIYLTHLNSQLISATQPRTKKKTSMLQRWRSTRQVTQHMLLLEWILQ